jgi:hypothetical protein
LLKLSSAEALAEQAAEQAGLAPSRRVVWLEVLARPLASITGLKQCQVQGTTAALEVLAPEVTARRALRSQQPSEYSTTALSMRLQPRPEAPVQAA